MPCNEGRPALCEPGAVANGAGTLLSGQRRLADGHAVALLKTVRDLGYRLDAGLG